MVQLTTRDRMSRMLAHQTADRIPITDFLWPSTLERWRAEGLPADADWVDYFGLDRFPYLPVDNSPRYPIKVLEDTPEYRIATTAWGATQKQWKHKGGVPENLNFTITDRASWLKAKARMTPTRDRIPDWFKRAYPEWRNHGDWLVAGFWFGFDVTHSWLMGTEQVLTLMADDPELLVDIFNHCLDMNIALFDLVWAEGYRFDAMSWPDDMGYKGHQFFSVDMYRELLKPVHKRAADWGRSKGIVVGLHSCGDIRPLIPDLLDIGIQMLNPIEVKAGMDPIALKKQYGDQLVFHGGINAALFVEPEKMEAHVRATVPVMKQNGGYVFASDHSVPDSVSLEQFREFVKLAKELGSYE